MFLQVLTIIFVLAKLAGHDMSWWIVFLSAAIAAAIEILSEWKN